MLAETRSRLATQQAELVSALMANGTIPCGFDAARLQVAAESLRRKRCRAVARAWPAVARSLGEEYRELFAAYADTKPLPQRAGPLADGRGFAHWLSGRGLLPEAARVQALAVDLEFASTEAGLVPRRGVTIKAAWLRQPRRLVLAVRLPWLGERWLVVPFWR